jgi:transcriptional regulator with XRE-family HTH domain
MNCNDLHIAMADEWLMTFGRNLRAERELRQWTQQFLAHKFGKKQATVADYEAGRIVPPLEILFLCWKLFGKNPYTMTGREEFKQFDSVSPMVSEAALDIARRIDAIPDDDWRKKAILEILKNTKPEESSDPNVKP